MNLIELYQIMPVAQHNNIRVVGNRAYVKKDDGSVEEYVLGDDGELWLLPSPLAEITTRLGNIEKGMSQITAKLAP
jgi:hypothetical protein